MNANERAQTHGSDGPNPHAAYDFVQRAPRVPEQSSIHKEIRLDNLGAQHTMTKNDQQERNRCALRLMSFG